MGMEKLGLKLAERAARYVKACGKRSILETKPVGNIDTSQIGVCLSDGTIHFPKLNMTRFRTAEEAEAHAKEVVMKQFNVPIAEQREIAVATWGRDYYHNTPGQHCRTASPIIYSGNNHPRGKTDLVHNHPSHNEIGDSVPLSGNDLQTLIMNESHSVTALNKAGEYNTATVIDMDKAYGQSGIVSSIKLGKMLVNEQFPYMMGKDGKRLLELRGLKEKQTLTPELEAELKNLEIKFENFRDSDMAKFMEEHVDEYVQILHRAYKKILPQFGIEYKTNFSNLLKYDA